MRDRIIEDLKNAMKAQDKDLLNVIRAVKGDMQLEEINLKHILSDDELIGVIAKNIKTRKESLIEFEKGKRQDLIDLTNKEIDILSKYLPEQLSLEDVKKLIEDAFNIAKPTSIKEMGKVMSLVQPKVKGRFDMKEVSTLVKERLERL